MIFNKSITSIWIKDSGGTIDNLINDKFYNHFTTSKEWIDEYQMWNSIFYEQNNSLKASNMRYKGIKDVVRTFNGHFLH